jgi:hypothetical protein
MQAVIGGVRLTFEGGQGKRTETNAFGVLNEDAMII